MPTVGDSVRDATAALRKVLGAGERAGGGICVLTGAGASAASGIPTFRDALTGLWAKFDPAQLATPEAFARDPKLVTRWYDERRLACARCRPNAGHRAIASLQELADGCGVGFTLITQNVDDLHERAGSRDIVRLHGSLFAWRCCETGEAWAPPPPPEPIPTYPPRTPSGTLARPGVVWFGEPLPEGSLWRAFAAAEECAVFLSVGTSGVVQPAATLPAAAADAGAVVIEVNPEETPMTASAGIRVRTGAEVLEEIVREAGR